jgi:hypothetical protein
MVPAVMNGIEQDGEHLTRELKLQQSGDPLLNCSTPLTHAAIPLVDSCGRTGEEEARGGEKREEWCGVMWRVVIINSRRRFNIERER